MATLVVLVTIVTIGTMLTKPVYRAEAKLEIGKETERVMQGQQIPGHGKRQCLQSVFSSNAGGYSAQP